MWTHSVGHLWGGGVLLLGPPAELEPGKTDRWWDGSLTEDNRNDTHTGQTYKIKRISCFMQ